MSSSSQTTRLGREPAGREAQLAQHDKPAKIQILYDVTNDSPDGEPWPPPDSNVLWAVVRRANGRTLWRAIQLTQVRSTAPDVCNFPRQQMTSQRRIPPCGRGLSSSSWCEIEIVQGVWTCLACNSIAPGNITAEFV
jgi:hypothetical protein